MVSIIRLETNIDRVESVIDSLVTSLVNSNNHYIRTVIRDLYDALVNIAHDMRTYLNICTVLLSKGSHSIEVFLRQMELSLNYFDSSSSDKSTESKFNKEE